jgi:hypothetical protein
MRVCNVRLVYIPKCDCVTMYIVSILLVIDLEKDEISYACASVSDLTDQNEKINNYRS